MQKYDPKQLEPKWQKLWAETKLYETKDNDPKPKWYQLEFFPYPSGVTMHVGHVRNYVISDAFARYKRMAGYNLLHPMGWDAFGLPAENQAIKTGIPPRESTDANIKIFKRQLTQVGISYDWSREIDTSRPEYYRWTQWLFLLLHRHNLAYKQKAVVNWCPNDKTVLANEQVIKKDGVNVCERCGHPVEKRSLPQWFFGITKYADRLLNDLDAIDWSESIKAMQRNWIGRSIGAEIEFAIVGQKGKITVFTTRPDTIYGATYMVLAPEHTLVKTITTSGQREAVDAYVAATEQKTDIQRMSTEGEKTGVFTGAYVVNPATKAKIPILISDYVLWGYGTGAIMAVPAHDQRDFEFAQKFELPIVCVVEPVTGTPQPDPEFRRSIVALVERQDSKLLSINWGSKLGGNLFIGGGLEGDEDPVAAAQREIAEETGYTDVELVDRSETIHHHYFAASKNKQRQIAATGLHFKLKSDRKEKPKLEADETGKFKVEWLTPAEAEARIKDSLHAYVFTKFVRQQAYTGEGIMVNSGPYNGMSSAEAREAIVRADSVRVGSQEQLVFGEPHSESESRQTISAVITRPQDNKVLIIRWKQFGWYAPVIGGIDGDESPEEAVVREVLEETGYAVKPVRRLGAVIESHFYAENKQVWRARTDQPLVVEVTNAKQQKVVGEDTDKFELHWLEPEEAIRQITHRDNAIGLVRFLGKQSLVMTEGEWTGGKLPESLPAFGSEKVNYKMRDWLISRQRYWGAPIPIVYCKKCGIVPVPEDQLPVELPFLETYQPSDDGRSPLARASDWLRTKCSNCGGEAERETDTMDTFVDSSWYFLRFTNPHNTQAPFDPTKANYWMSVDNYVGGAEHAVAHLLFARFMTKVLHDEGMLSVTEPFHSLRNHGMIGGHDGRKMGKRYGNSVTPDEIIEQGYGADSLRLYELFIGPYDQGVDWNPTGIDGTKRFLNRVWALVRDHLEAKGATDRAATGTDEALETAVAIIVHKAIRKVTIDLESFSFNTAIAAMMEAVNELYRLKTKLPLGSDAWQQNLKLLVQILAPFAPHIAEELWQQLGGEGSVHIALWPAFDVKLVTDDLVTIVIQVNGKLRGQIEVAADTSEAEVKTAAATGEAAARHLKDKKIIKTIYVSGKLVNFVVT